MLFTRTLIGDHSPSEDSWTRMNLGLRCSVLTPLSPLTSCSIVKALLPSLSSIQPSSTFRQRTIRPKLLASSCSSCFAVRFFYFFHILLKWNLIYFDITRFRLVLLKRNSHWKSVVDKRNITNNKRDITTGRARLIRIQLILISTLFEVSVNCFAIILLSFHV